MSRITQFNWSRHWKKRAEPYLDVPLVRASVEMGMKTYDQTWTWEDGPHAIGNGRWNGQRVTTNKLSWYQPWGRCHWIAFFACAIGVLNHPKFDWHFISGHCHTVPVGSWNGEHKVVMDILNFKSLTAEGSIELAQRIIPDRPDLEESGWSEAFNQYIEVVVPVLRYLAHAGPKMTTVTQAPAGAGQLTNAL